MPLESLKGLTRDQHILYDYFKSVHGKDLCGAMKKALEATPKNFKIEVFEEKLVEKFKGLVKSSETEKRYKQKET